MNTNTSSLDAEELLHLALRSSAQNHHEEAISYLKRALEQDPRSAKLHYMLGAEHAEIGLYDRAIEEISSAVRIDPNLHTACFQLGLLYVTSGQAQRAIEAWAPLDSLGADNFLYLFKKGLVHLVKDEFDACIQALEKGMALNHANEALNRDMKKILDDVKKSTPQIDTKKTADAGAPKGKTGKVSNVLLSAYQTGKEEKQ
jgi:tetratricopeptide (TPR) repeat protein